MLRARNQDPLSLANPKSSGAESRRAGRLRCQAVRCSLGEVLDLSAGGMRVAAKRDPGISADTVFDVRIDSPTGPCTVKAHVVWVTKRGWRRYELGVRFVELTPESRATLTLIARAAPTNTTFHTPDAA